MLARPADLPVLALVQADREPGVGPLLAVEGRPDGAVADAADGQAPGELVQLRGRDPAVDAHPVAADPAGRGQLEVTRQVAVVGEQQQPLGGEVEAPDRQQARQSRGQALENGRPALPVAAGDQTGRLVIAPQTRRLGHGERPAVDGDAGSLAHRDGGRGQGLAIDRDPALGDPAFGFAPGAQPGAGDALRDPHSLPRGAHVLVKTPGASFHESEGRPNPDPPPQGGGWFHRDRARIPPPRRGRESGEGGQKCSSFHAPRC